MEEGLPCTTDTEEPHHHALPPSQTQMRTQGTQARRIESEWGSQNGVNHPFYFGSATFWIVKKYSSQWYPKGFAESGHKASAHAERPPKRLVSPEGQSNLGQEQGPPSAYPRVRSEHTWAA